MRKPNASYVARALAASVLALFARAPDALAQSWLVAPASRIQAGDAANASSATPFVSPEGRWIAFNSGADNVVAGQVDAGETDVFLLDRQTNTMTLVSHAADDPLRASAPGFSQVKAIAFLGITLFDSSAPFLIPGQTAGFTVNTYVHTPLDGTNRLVSHAAGAPETRSNGECRGRAIDPNGQAVVMACTSTNLQAGVTDTNSSHDLYFWTAALDASTLVTHAFDSATTAANGGFDAFGGRVLLTGDRRWIAFTSRSTNLVDGIDTNNAEDVFLYDTQSGVVRLVSHVAANQANAGAAGASLVAVQGGFVIFNSANTNHVAGATDANGASDVFSYDIATGAIALVTHAVGQPLVAANGASTAAQGGSAQRVLIETTATNLANGWSGAITRDVVLWSRVSDTFQLVSHAASGTNVRANAQSRAVATNLLATRAVFESSATNLASPYFAAFTNASNLYAHDWTSNTSTLLTHLQGRADIGSARPADPASVRVNENGNAIVYATAANDVSPSIDGNAVSDVYAYDYGTNASALVSRAAFALDASASRQTTPVGMSADGRYVLASSNATNLSFDQNESDNDADVFLYDAESGTQKLVSHAIEGFEVLTNVPANAPSVAKAISRDGNWILFSSAATNLIALQDDANGVADVFLAARTGGMNLVSHSSFSTGVAGNGAATPAALSADGRWVLYESNATNVVAGTVDANAASDVFLFDRIENKSVVVSKALAAATTANGLSRAVALSPDGRWALYQSRATNLVPGFVDQNGAGEDLYLYDRASATSRLVSAEAGNPARGANATVTGVALADDGDTAVFYTSAGNLVAGGSGNGSPQTFIRRIAGATTYLVSHVPGSQVQPVNGVAVPQALSADGAFVVFSTNAPDVVNGFVDGNGAAVDVYRYDATTRTNLLVSRSAGSATTSSNREWRDVALSADGTRIAFATLASDVIAGVNPGSFFSQVYQVDLATGARSLVSHRAGAALEANQNSGTPVTSPDGTRVAFESSATNLVAWSDRNDARDTFYARRIDGFVVTPIVTGNGTIDPAGAQSVAPGAAATYVLTPGTGQRIVAASGCGGTLNGNVYTTGPVSADCTVAFEFAPQQFTLRYLIDPARGTLTGATTQIVDYGGSGSAVLATPNAGFQFDAWSDGRPGGLRVDANVTADVTVTALFTVQQVRLTYRAGPGGTIDGQSSRTFDIDYGTDGPTVTAIPANGQAFVRWSDGVATAQRTDLAVTANLDVEAEFGVNPNFTVTPIVGANGSATPASPQSVPPGGTTFFDLVADAGYRIGSASGCNGSLSGNRYTTGPVFASCTVTFAFNRTPVAQDGTLAAQEDGGSYGGVLSASDDDALAGILVTPPTKGQLLLQPNLQYVYTPNPDENGSDSFVFRVSDGVQQSNTATVSIAIAPVNDRPSFTLDPAVLPEYPEGTSGSQTRAGILANVDFGPPDEDATQSIASVQVTEISDPSNVVANAAISNAGVLTWVLTGNAGLARLNVTITDSGGGGTATSDPRQLTISVRNATDLQVSNTNGEASVSPGRPVVYEVLVANAGPYATTAARVDVPVPTGLANVLWSCNPVQLALCPQANGVGPIAALSVDLPRDGVLRFLVTGEVSATPGETLAHVATIATTGAMQEVDASNNSATDADPVVPLAEFLFGDGFETTPTITVPIPADDLLYPPTPPPAP